MPIYNYTCGFCSHSQEELRSMDERNIKANCQNCGKKAQKALSVPTILLDGSDPNFVAAHDRWVKEHEARGNGIRSY